MKRIKMGIILLSLFIGINFVKADTTYTFPLYKWNVNNIESLNLENAEQIISQYTQYNYYAIYFSAENNILDTSKYNIMLFNTPPNPTMITSCYYGDESCLNATIMENQRTLLEVNGEGEETIIAQNPGNTGMYSVINILEYQVGYSLYDSNYNFVSDRNLDITNFYSDTIEIKTGDIVPTYKELMEYNSWSDFVSQSEYTEVNLDNYEYVLLSLKNYNQTEAFQTNLQVKGQIGITPIYNFGQTSKDSITGVQVQDRCNVNYENYTNYPFYIIQSDLQNNVIYAVKECSSGSSFKFDNTIFDITYITQENKDNPTVTINGNTYDVIPYDDLPSTATKNEENNYIPGESGSANDTGGLDGAITGAQRKLSEIWNSITYFTSFIGQIFSSLPSEVHTILISAFTIMIMLGIIKIFLGK